MLGVLIFQVWKWNRLLAALTIGLFAARRRRLLRLEHHQGRRRRLVPAGRGRGDLHRPDHLGDRPAADARAARGGGACRSTVFIKSTAASVHRVRGTAVFLSASPDGIPSALLHNLKHNQVLHERVLILTVKVEDVPHVPPAQRLEVHDAGEGFYRVDPPLRLHGGGRHPARPRRASTSCGGGVRHDEHQLLPRPPEADRLRGSSPAWRCGASGCSPG